MTRKERSCDEVLKDAISKDKKTLATEFGEHVSVTHLDGSFFSILNAISYIDGDYLVVLNEHGTPMVFHVGDLLVVQGSKCMSRTKARTKKAIQDKHEDD